MINLSQSERTIASILADDLSTAARQAVNLLTPVLDSYFSDAEPQQLEAEAVKLTGETLSLVIGLLTTARVDFELVTGQNTPEARKYLENMCECANFAAVSSLNDTALTVEHGMADGPARLEFAEARAAACNMEDSKAAMEALKKLLDNTKGGTDA